MAGEQIVENALEETEVEGLSDEPVFVSEPEVLNWTQPRYPRSAQRRNQQGVVMLEVMVDEGGKAMKMMDEHGLADEAEGTTCTEAVAA